MTLDLNLKITIANTAMANMIRRGHLDICAIKSVIEVLGTTPNTDTLEALRLLHCVDFGRMPREVLQQLPALIHEAVGDPSIVIDFKASSDVQEILQEGKRKGWLSFGG